MITDLLDFKISLLKNPIVENFIFFHIFKQNTKDMELTLPIQKNGFCLINITVSSTFPNLQEKAVKAMLDTGASDLVISKRLFEELGLINTGKASARSFDSKEYDVTMIYFLIPGLTEFWASSRAAVKVGLEESGFDVIIGNSFMNHCLFERDGKKQSFTIKLSSQYLVS